ncbi:DC-STAMP domain-containing protein 2, partial [Melipona quadrifasciata]
CVVFLLLPQLFSKRGRQALMAYAFILALTGPVKNTLHNTGVLSESLACAQEQLKEAVRAVVDLAKQPFYALRDAISKVIKTIKAVVKKIKQTLIAIKRVVLSILRVITSVFQWLGSVINICNKKLGTPFDRCQAVFEGAVADCKAKLGPIFGLVCNITYVVSTVCYVVKPLDFICMLVSYIADTVVGVAKRKIKKFTMHMKAMFYVKVKFSHSFHFETNQSRTVGDVSSSIAAEIRSRTDKLFGFFDFMNFVTSFFIFLIILRVLRYRYKWLTSERFDNRYITNDLRTIDLIRARQDKETVLPLNTRERNRYVPITSVRLIKSERVKLAKSIVFLSLATIKFIMYISADYCLYWILNTIQLYGRFQSKVERPSVVTIHVSGEGYLADLYKSIVKAFTPRGKEAEIDTMLCLPNPITPDLDKYIQIVILIFLCWLMAFFEPYGLRMRQIVMCQYYPDRAKQRAAWLYNHIIRSRGSFLKFARRQLRRKFGLTEGEKIEKVTLKEKLWATFPLLNTFFPLKQKACLLCGAVERAEHLHVKCPTPGCVGLYCTQCFVDLQNLCTVCRSPMDYGDLSDMSEEKLKLEERERMLKEEDKMVGKEDIMIDEETVEEEYEEEYEDEDTVRESYEDVSEEECVDEEMEEEDEDEEILSEEEEVKRILIPDRIEERKKEKIAEEKERKKLMVEVENDVAVQTDDKCLEDLDQSTEYSYTYQDESPEEIEIVKAKERFKDVEAQKIRDDVTIQIFNQPFVKEPICTSESPTSGFVVRARRKVRAKLKKRPTARVKDTDSSSSTADTEFWPSEEVDEEEVIHIEMDDGSEELLTKDREDKRKLGRINRIVGAVARIPWLGKGESKKKTCKGLQKKRPSLMDTIVGMLHRKQSKPAQLYRKIKKTKNSSFSSSSSTNDETESLLRVQDRDTDRTYFAKSRKTSTEDNSDETLTRRTSYEKKFETKRLPRHLESAARDTAYFEIDETTDSRIGKYVRRVEDINESSDIKVPAGVKHRDTWSTTENDELVLLYLYLKEIVLLCEILSH